MKNKYLFTLLWVVCCGLYLPLKAQTTLIQHPISGPSFVIDQVWNVHITGSDFSGDVYLYASIRDGQQLEVVQLKSMAFRLQTGNQQVSAATLATRYTQVNSLVPYGSALNTYRTLPFGPYEVCLSLRKESDDEELAESCTDMEINMLQPALLLTPEDYEELFHFLPLFTWLAPTPANPGYPVKYDLKLVEVYPHQQPQEAIQVNTPLHFLQGYSNTFYQYGAGDYPLRINQYYAWQVEARYEHELAGSDGPGKQYEERLGVSEVYTFIIRGPIADPEVCFLHPYLNNTQPPTETVSGTLNMLFSDTTINPPLLGFSFLDEQQQEVETGLRLAFEKGSNMYSIDLKATGQFTSGHHYTLVIPSGDDTWYLKFQYTEEN